MPLLLPPSLSPSPLLSQLEGQRPKRAPPKTYIHDIYLHTNTPQRKRRIDLRPVHIYQQFPLSLSVHFSDQNKRDDHSHRGRGGEEGGKKNKGDTSICSFLHSFVFLSHKKTESYSYSIQTLTQGHDTAQLFLAGHHTIPCKQRMSFLVHKTGILVLLLSLLHLLSPHTMWFEIVDTLCPILKESLYTDITAPFIYTLQPFSTHPPLLPPLHVSTYI